LVIRVLLVGVDELDPGDVDNDLSALFLGQNPRSKSAPANAIQPCQPI
jgi:hypothetical protein